MFESVIDSGCTWHSHPRRDELIDVRLCDDRIATADGADHSATCIGTLPVLAYDSEGAQRFILIANVRCVPFFTDTLISVDELRQQSRFDIRFKDIREIHPYTASAQRRHRVLPSFYQEGRALRLGARDRDEV